LPDIITAASVSEKLTQNIYKPGSIVRISSSLTELERKPEVVYLEFNENGIHIEEIELKTARPGDEVLDREKLEAAKDRNLSCTSFTRELRHREGTKK